jgi:hypothetical protein
LRRRSVERALDRGQFTEVGSLGVLLLTLAAMALALDTLAIIIAQP